MESYITFSHNVALCQALGIDETSIKKKQNNIIYFGEVLSRNERQFFFHVLSFSYVLLVWGLHYILTQCNIVSDYGHWSKLGRSHRVIHTNRKSPLSWTNNLKSYHLKADQYLIIAWHTNYYVIEGVPGL